MGKYFANFSTNNGSCLMKPAEYTSKKDAVSSIRRWAVGETFAGNEFTWYVEDENGNEVARGGGRVSRSGKMSYHRTL